MHVHQKPSLVPFVPRQCQAQIREFCVHFSTTTVEQFSSSAGQLVGIIANEEENPCRETTLQLDHDTIAAIINGDAAKLQKALARKGEEPSTSLAGPSKGAGKETTTIQESITKENIHYPHSTRQGVKTLRGSRICSSCDIREGAVALFSSRSFAVGVIC